MPRDFRLILKDILDAIDAAREACKGIDVSEFYNSRLRCLAAQRALEIVSEASRHLPQEVLDRHPSQPWLQIRAYGNFVRHEYFRIDDQTIWNAIQYSLPGLEAAILEEERRLQTNSGQSDA
jgi:uncharacterized protein with HEPN domain